MDRKLSVYNIPEYIDDFDICIDMETGEIKQCDDMLESISRENSDRDTKALGVAKKIDLMKREASQIRQKARSLSLRAKSIERGYSLLIDYLKTIVPYGEKIKDSEIQVNWRKSTSVAVSCDVDSLPSEYIITKKSIDKIAIKEFIKNGGSIKDAHLVECNNLCIK